MDSVSDQTQNSQNTQNQNLQNSQNQNLQNQNQQNQQAQANEAQRPPIESFIPGQSGEGATPQQGNAGQKVAKKKGRAALYAGIAIILIMIVAAVFLVSKPTQHAVTTTSIFTTTIQQPVMTEIANCTTISKPGRYYLTKSISTNLARGACISVDASNVEIIGNFNKIKGNGPFVGVPPFTYGIFVKNASNVTISSIDITQFSFGIYFQNVDNSTISNSNITKNTISNIFLNNSRFNDIEYTTTSLSSSASGSISILDGGSNIFLNDSIYGNAYYGFVVNSIGNRFINDVLSNNPQDFVCYKEAGFSNSNLFSDTTCKNNLYCNFAWCSQSNVELNISQITLPYNISNCGYINTPGTYTLTSNILANDYFNMSNPSSKSITCITINSPDVVLNCNTHAIKNAGIGIKLSGNFNNTIKNCLIENNSYGIYLNNSFYPRLENVTLTNNTYGLYVNNMNSGSAFYINGSGNKYGVFINNTNTFTLSNFNFSKNQYGIYVNTGGSNIYNNGVAEKNTYGDIYCTASSYNVSPSLFTDVSCGLTDCNWGTSCARHALPPISVYPLNNCTTITIPGSYSINSNIKAVPNCFNIKTSNVSINCMNNYIAGSYSGSAFELHNVSNVDISNCRISQFATGFSITNSSYITIQNINISKVGFGVDASNLVYSKIINVNTTGFYNAGFYFNKLNSSIVNGDTALNGVNSSSGFIISNSTKNIISFNNANQNQLYGFMIYNSNNNNIFNNTAYSNKIDYYCSPSSSGVYAELNGVNFGSTKANCHWLVELNSQSLSQTPLSISSSSTLVLTQDILYPYGEILYNIYNTKQSSANNTLINCNYHTILATHGGTFANIENASNVKIENCYLINFTNAIKGGSQTELEALNNTIVHSDIAISATSASYPKIVNNTILNSSYGIFFVNTNYGTLQKNYIADSNISIELAGGLGYQITKNIANHGSIGMYIINSTTNILQGNIFTNMSRYGIACTGLATNTSISLNKDYGNNVCSSNFECYWMTSSSLCTTS